MLIKIISTLNWIILWYLIILSLVYLTLFIFSIPEVLNRFKENQICHIRSLFRAHSFLPVTIIVSTYNEEKTILDVVFSIINNDYPNTHIIVVNDGSTDDTMQKLLAEFDLVKIIPFSLKRVDTKGPVEGYYVSKLYPKLTVIDKQHTDKSDSLNVGLNATHTPLFMTVDADTLLEKDAVSMIVYYMLNTSHTIAVGGSVYILNDNTYENGKITKRNVSLNPIVMFQLCEYLRSFLFSRSGWNRLGGALCYSGTCTLFMYHAVVEVGGFQIHNKAQDFEIITHLHEQRLASHKHYHIGYTPAAVSRTIVPQTLKRFWKQRFDWQYYSLESLFSHLNMLFNAKYGIVGLFTYPFFLFGEILGGVVEFFAYASVIITWSLGILDAKWAILFFTVSIGFSVFLTIATALINYITFNEYRKLQYLLYIWFYCIVENFGFRQYNAACKAYATICFVKDKLLGFLKAS